MTSEGPQPAAAPRRPRKKSLDQRIEGDLERGDLASARRRIESRLQIETDPLRAGRLRTHLIQVLVQMGDPERAGMYALLVEDDSAELNSLRTLFIRRCGGSSQTVKDRTAAYRRAVGPRAQDRLDQLFMDLTPFKAHPEKWRKINLNESLGTFIFLGIMLVFIVMGVRSCS